MVVKMIEKKNANANVWTYVRIRKIFWNKWAIRLEKVLHIAIIHDLANAGNGIWLRLESDIHSNMNDLWVFDIRTHILEPKKRRWRKKKQPTKM